VIENDPLRHRQPVSADHPAPGRPGTSITEPTTDPEDGYLLLGGNNTAE